LTQNITIVIIWLAQGNLLPKGEVYLFLKQKNKCLSTLFDLCTGESGIIMCLDVSGSLKRRLIDMGFTPGVQILVKREAPLGDPIQINLRGYELSIRKSDAQNIKIIKSQ